MSKIIIFEKIGDPKILTLVDHAVPAPGPDEVQIEVQYAGLNRAELLFMTGQYLLQPTLPSKVGVEASGLITQLGEGIDDVSIGDAVSVFPTIDIRRYGLVGEIANVPRWALIPKPPTISFEAAAAFWMAYGTAWGGLVQEGGLAAGLSQIVIISAASSSVGLAAIDIAKSIGSTVIATTRTRDKAEVIKSCGADHVVVTDEQDLVERVHSITGGHGFDIAFDPINGPFVELLAKAAAKDAVIVEYGGLSGETATLPFFSMISNGLAIRTFHLGFDLSDHAVRFDRAKAYLLPKLESGEFKPLIDKTFPLIDTRAAYERLASNEQIGKIMIDVCL